jgi:hypothetical protein
VVHSYVVSVVYTRSPHERHVAARIRERTQMPTPLYALRSHGS